MYVMDHVTYVVYVSRKNTYHTHMDECCQQQQQQQVHMLAHTHAYIHTHTHHTYHTSGYQPST